MTAPFPSTGIDLQEDGDPAKRVTAPPPAGPPAGYPPMTAYSQMQSVPLQPPAQQGQQPQVYPQPYGTIQQQPFISNQPYGMQQPFGVQQPYNVQTYGMQQQVPVMTQPQMQPIQWMPAPAPIPNCPPGLEYLNGIDQLLVKQEIEIMELLTGLEMCNKYRVFNNMGQSVYYAVEESEAFARQCLGSLRLFDVKVLDNAGNEIIHIFRPFRCGGCCYPQCMQQLEVTAPVGDVVGYVTQLWSMSKQYFQIENANREPLLKIIGPFCTFTCGQDVIFQVMSLDEKSQVGTIRKQWSGLIRESVTDADNFGITFPVDLDVRMKAVMLGACFLIDFMFYEQPPQRNQNRRRHY